MLCKLNGAEHYISHGQAVHLLASKVEIRTGI